jgi:DNA replication protein DnaC
MPKSNDKNLDSDLDISKVPQYLYVSSKSGEELASINPEWKKLQILKYFNYYLKMSGIPENYWSYTLDNIHVNSTILDQAKEFVSNVDTDKTASLYLWGDNSTGKTTVACVIAKELIKLNLNCFYMLSSDVIDSLMASSGYNTSMTDEISVIRNRLKEVDILIIDDIFDKNKSLYWSTQSNNLIIGQWDYLIRYRCSHRKKNIFTSNIDIKQVYNDFGKSVGELLEANFKFIKLGKV